MADTADEPPTGAEFAVGAGKAVAAGASTGALIGGIAGSVVPGIGNAVGATIGTYVGVSVAAISQLVKAIKLLRASRQTRKVPMPRPLSVCLQIVGFDGKLQDGDLTYLWDEIEALAAGLPANGEGSSQYVIDQVRASRGLLLPVMRRPACLPRTPLGLTTKAVCQALARVAESGG
jgi:hypothetical protein